MMMMGLFGGYKGAKPPVSIPDGLDSNKINVNAIWSIEVWKAVYPLILFRAYKERLKVQVVVLQNIEDEKRAMIVSPKHKSRYFEVGRWRIARAIKKRLGRFDACPGVLLGLTYDGELLTKLEAWQRYGEDIRRFLNSLNQYRRRRGWRRLSYLWVVENQDGTGYPHIHIFFPKLKWLAPKDYLARLWGNGSTRVEGIRTINGGAYVTKYIRKLKGWSEMSLSLLWLARGRLYGFSKGFFKSLVKKAKEWRLWLVESVTDMVTFLENLSYVFDDVSYFSYWDTS